MHLTFEEYYAARHLVARSKDRANLIRKHLQMPRWEEPILLALGFVELDSPEDAADLPETAILAESEEARELGFTLNPFIIDALFHNADASVRSNAAWSLGRLAQSSPEVIKVLIEGLHQDKYSSASRDLARLLGQIGQSDEQTIQALWHGLLDENYDVRTTCAQALAELGRRFPDDAETIEKKLIQAIEYPAFDKPDSILKRSGHDYAYDGLWLLVVGGELQGN